MPIMCVIAFQQADYEMNYIESGSEIQNLLIFIQLLKILRKSFKMVLLVLFCS